MYNRSLLKLVIASLTILFLSRIAMAQDQSNTPAALPQQANISEVMAWLDTNGLAQARIGVRTSSRPAKQEVVGGIKTDAYPALNLFYAEGFRLVEGDVCGVILKNDDARLLAHSKLVDVPPPGQRYTAELFIPLSGLSVKKSKGPYRHTSNPDKAHLLGTWRTEFKSKGPKDDIILTLFDTSQTQKLNVLEAETVTFTFEDKETSEKFTTGFRQAIKICQPIKYLMRKEGTP